MTAPKIGERHRECAKELDNPNWQKDENGIPIRRDTAAEIIAKHFPEDDSWVERAAEEIFCEIVGFGTISRERAREIINGCRRG